MSEPNTMASRALRFLRLLGLGCRRVAGWTLAGARGLRKHGPGALRRLRKEALGLRHSRPVLAAQRWAWAMALVFGGLWLLRSGVTQIGPGEVGVLRREFGSRGIVQRDFGPGLYWNMPGASTWYRLPSGRQRVRLDWNKDPDGYPPLEVTLEDGNSASVLLSAAFRIAEGRAHRLVAAGRRSQYPHQARAALERIALEQFASLDTQAITNTEQREACLAEVQARLQSEWADLDLAVLSVDVHGVFFQGQFEKKLQEKQLLEQKKETARIAALVDRQGAQIDARQLEIQQAEDSLKREVFDRMAVMRASHAQALAGEERERLEYKRSKALAAHLVASRAIAEGEAARQAAQTLETELHTTALQSPGGRMHLARQAAGKLRIREVTLNSNDPRVPTVLDLDGLVELLIGKQ